MSQSTKERIRVDFQKAKSLERLRAERIQSIIQEAFAKTWAEINNGTGEIRGIVQDNASDIWARLKKIENENDEGAKKTPEHRLKSVVIAVSKVLKNRLLAYWRQASKDWHYQDSPINHEVNPDRNGIENQDNRYELWKHRLDKFVAWYSDVKGKSQTRETSVVEQKQTEWENKLGAAGITVAQRERQVKQQLREWMQIATAKR